MITENILTAIGLIGLGGLLKSAFDYLISIQKSKQDAKNSFKEIRYKAIVLLSYDLVNYEKQKSTLIINRPDLNSLNQLKNELHTEFVNMSLYACDNVIIAMKNFIEKQDNYTLYKLALSMRKDLYGIKTKLNENHFDIISIK